jgi:DNA repair exonuclease SbcCD ATPase subunit
MDRNTFKENAKKSIDEIFNKIEELESKKDTLSESLKAEYDKKIAELKLKRIELKSNLDDMEKVAESKLDELKGTVEAASASFKDGFNKLADLFK